MGRKDRKHINSQDNALFRDAIGGTEPLKSRHRHTAKPLPAARVLTRQEEAAAPTSTYASDTAYAAEIEAGEELRFKRSDLSERIFSRLRRAKIPPQDELDLHGLTAAEAHSALRDFIVECAGSGLSCVRVIHGKGLGSGKRYPVLKNGVNSWLRQWHTVLAFCSAPPNDGGTGACYVLLKKIKPI